MTSVYLPNKNTIDEIRYPLDIQILGKFPGFKYWKHGTIKSGQYGYFFHYIDSTKKLTFRQIGPDFMWKYVE